MRTTFAVGFNERMNERHRLVRAVRIAERRLARSHDREDEIALLAAIAALEAFDESDAR